VQGSALAQGLSLEEALTLFRDVGDRHGQAEVLISVGALLADTSGPTHGLTRLTDALGIARDIGAPEYEADALDGIGRCYIQACDTAAARTHLRQALEIYQRIGSPGAERVQKTLDDHNI
jgi:tetratricopeptide (TPR) repeat protein